MQTVAKRQGHHPNKLQRESSVISMQKKIAICVDKFWSGRRIWWVDDSVNLQTLRDGFEGQEGFFRGILAPAFRASLSAIATACLRLLTLPPLPDLRSPSLYSFMTLRTFRLPVEFDDDRAMPKILVLSASNSTTTWSCRIGRHAVCRSPARGEYGTTIADHALVALLKSRDEEEQMFDWMLPEKHAIAILKKDHDTVKELFETFEKY